MYPTSVRPSLSTVVCIYTYPTLVSPSLSPIRGNQHASRYHWIEGIWNECLEGKWPESLRVCSSFWVYRTYRYCSVALHCFALRYNTQKTTICCGTSHCTNPHRIHHFTQRYYTPIHYSYCRSHDSRIDPAVRVSFPLSLSTRPPLRPPTYAHVFVRVWLPCPNGP